MRPIANVSLVVLSLELVVASGARAQAPLADDTARALEASVDRALAAYNAQDSKAFYAEFASSMASIATDQAFKTLYIDNSMKNLGKYVSRKMIKEQSVLSGDFPLLVYEAEFALAKKVKVSVNFTRDGAALKIMQVRFDKQ